MSLEIITNNQPRPLLTPADLTESELAEFDYEYSGDFVRYKGEVYDLGEFMMTGSELSEDGWVGIYTETFFSALLVKFAENSDEVVMGHAFS